MEETKTSKNIWRKTGRIILRSVIFLVLFFLLLAGLILLPPVQGFISQKAVAYLEKKLGTKVALGKLYIGLPKTVVLENVYIEDKQKDTLLFGGSLKVDVGIFDLILGKGININSIKLDNITANIKRQLPDTSFNFRFIIDAFAPKDQQPKEDTGTSSTNFSIGSIELNNIRAVYRDVVTGNDVAANLAHFDTRFSEFDLQKMQFGIPVINLQGLTADIHQFQPLIASSTTGTADETGNTTLPSIDIRSIGLQKINVSYRNDVSALYALIDMGALDISPGKIDPGQRTVDLVKLALNQTTAAVRLGKTQAGSRDTITTAPASGDTAPGWRVLLSSLQLNNNNFQFDDDNAPRANQGMDYMHLKAEGLTLHASDFIYSNDSIAGIIKKGAFREQSGFALQQLQADFLYSGTQAYLKNFYIKTPGTELRRNAAISYASLASLQKNIETLQLNIDLDHSKVQVKDILSFAPFLRSQPAFADPGAVWLINGKVKGSVADMQIAGLQVSGLSNTSLNISGRLTGLPDANKTGANLTIKNISTSREDILSVVPENVLPANITLPGKMQLSGTIHGNMENIETALTLQTSLGDAIVKGFARHIANAHTAVYDMTLQAYSLDLGTILQDKKTFGPVTADFAIKGKGYDPKTADAAFAGNIRSVILKQYDYKDLNIEGSIVNKQARIHAAIADPNIHLGMNATADFTAAYPAVTLNADIDSIRFHELHLSNDHLIYHGKIDGSFPDSNPDSLEGKLFVLQSLLVHNQQRISIDSIRLEAGSLDTARYLALSSDVINARLQGRYKLTEMGSIIQKAIEPYFSTADSAGTVSRTAPYDFTFHADIVNSPVLKAFVPDLQKLDSVNLQSHFTDSSGWNADLHAGAVYVGENHIKNLVLNAGTEDSSLIAGIKADEIVAGKSLAMFATSLHTNIHNNNIDFTLNIRDKAEKSRYIVNGLFRQPAKGEYVFSLNPDSLLLNYSNWTLSPENNIHIEKDDLHATNFTLSKNEQQLSVNSVSAGKNAPLDISFNNFKIATLTGFAQPDSTLADGILNGKITVSNIIQQPVFVGNLDVKDLSIKKDTVGNVQVAVNNKVADTYNADISVTGHGNDIHLSGNYFTNSSTFDATLDIRKLPLTTAQAFSGGAIRDASGAVNGQFNIAGSTDKPSVDGELNFDKAAFNLSMLNNIFRVDREKIAVNKEGIRFNKFSVKDSAGNALTVDGLAATQNFKNYNFDLDIRADNFRALNSTKKDNKLFYGQLYFDTRLKVKGTESSPAVDGRLSVNNKTKMTIVLPQNEPGVVDREGIVVFVDKDAPASDSLFRASYDSLNTSSLQGMDISVNIDVDKAADFTLVVDEGSGDFLNVKGEAQLNAGIDPSGKINLSGSYELESGSYDLTFNFIKRKFNIEKGSKIVWEGEPTDASVDITAKYTANTAPLDLVKNQLAADVSSTQRNMYLQKLPFDVILKMGGKLLKPTISFDIMLEEDKATGVSNDIVSDVKTKLELLRQEDAEMNKQVFALLLLNRFVADDPFKSSSSTSTSTMVKQSVSKLMTEQLNRMAADIIKGVDVNFDVNASDDYTTGERQSRTDLNVGLSKRLLNDRLTVTVGSNFELEGPENSSQQPVNLAGNVSLNYRLSEDGRYMLRGYRKNEYEGQIDGYVVETGIGFTITLDYNRFKEIFRKKQTAEERRKIRELRQQYRQKGNSDTGKE
ncbi:MAG: translocation/assembly module TamB [Sphingobacteriales bacterium]|nr:translocation/assembly module TamB [Sphingobacteriales bacterium]